MGSAEPVKFSDPMKGSPWIFEDLTQLLSQIWDLEPTKFWKELTWNYGGLIVLGETKIINLIWLGGLVSQLPLRSSLH